MKTVDELMKGFTVATKEQIATANIFGTPQLAAFVEAGKVTKGKLLDKEPRAEEWKNSNTGETGVRVGFPFAVNINGQATVKLLKITGLTPEVDLAPFVGKEATMQLNTFTPEGSENPVKFVKAVL